MQYKVTAILEAVDADIIREYIQLHPAIQIVAESLVITPLAQQLVIERVISKPPSNS